MNSDQILKDTANQKIEDSRWWACAHWLREIAYQLAVMNERNANEKAGLNVVLCASNDDIPVRITS